METEDLQPQVWAYLPSAWPNPTALWWAEPAPQERGFPLDSPALHPRLHCWPRPAPWAPAREQTLAPLPSTEWEGKGCCSPSQEPQPGNGIKSEWDDWGCRGAGTKAQGPGAGAGLRGWGGRLAWRSREEQGGSLFPTLSGCESQECCSCSWRWHSGKQP